MIKIRTATHTYMINSRGDRTKEFPSLKVMEIIWCPTGMKETFKNNKCFAEFYRAGNYVRRVTNYATKNILST